MTCEINEAPTVSFYSSLVTCHSSLLMQRIMTHLQNNVIRVGTRGSALALKQTQGIADSIAARCPDLGIEIVPIKTTGDRMQDIALAKIGGKGVFVKEIEEALMRNEIDLAVHSMKDVPSEIPEALTIGAVPLREDPRDVLISRSGVALEDLPPGARIGTGSLRRGIQIKARFPLLEVTAIRGNLDTRIRKIETESLAGIVLAAAGLARLGWRDRISHYIAVDVMIPAIGQGALALQCRKDNVQILETIAFLNHEQTVQAVAAERAFLRVFGGGCQVPIAAHATVQGDRLKLTGLIGSLDGSCIIRDNAEGPVATSETIGISLANRLLDQGGRGILEELKTVNSK